MTDQFVAAFKRPGAPGSRGKYLSRVFGIFSEEIVRIWAADPRAPFEDLGRPTLRVDGDAQDLFLRKGASPADTLASSPTAQEWFLVEWHDLARLQAPAGPGGAESPTPVQAMNWSGIKKNWAPGTR